MQRCAELRRLTLLWTIGLSLAACGEDTTGQGSGGDGGDSSSGGTGGATGGVDGSSSGAEDGGTGGGTAGSDGDDGGEPAFEVESVFGVPNLDDDNADGADDWLNGPFPEDNEFSTLEIPPVSGAAEIELRLTGDLESVRLWQDGSYVLGSGNEEIRDTHRFAASPEGATLQVEWGDYNTAAALDVVVLDEAQQELELAQIELRASPLIMNHHLQPAEHLWVVEVNQGGYGSNASMIQSYVDALGDFFTPVPGPSYGGDVWIQDEIEFGTSLGSEGQRLDTVIDSIRDRGLDDFAEDALEGPDFVGATWGQQGTATTYDSFGNLEASPPVTVDGVEYPFGRIYYGREDDVGLNTILGDFLAEQTVQAPFELDTLWLCVGHVDEYSTFIPDASAPKGFRLLISDIDAGYELLESIPAQTSLPRYQQTHGYGSVGELLSDAGLRALNEDLQEFEIDPIREKFKAELGLTDEDIIEVPSLFEEVSSYCGGRVAALIPGMVNLIVADIGDGATKLFIPDPFVRAAGAPQSEDLVIADFTERLPDELELHFVDNWDVYHAALGEVHCGTNVKRTPVDQWWATAMHLLEM